MGWGQVLWDIIGWGRPYDAIVYVTVIKMQFKLTNVFFFIGLDRSHLTNLSRSGLIWFVDSECNQLLFWCQFSPSYDFYN